MEVLLINLLLGVSFGFILFLLGTGLSLTMGLMRIVNLAHGALYMVGAYIGVSVGKFTGNFVLGILAGGISAGLIGLIMEMGALRRLYKRDLAQVLLTIGLIYMFINICQWIWGPLPMSGVIPSILSGSVQVWKVTIPAFRLALIVVGLVFAVGLWLFQEKTRIGAIIRAGMDNKEMTTGLGINLKVVFTGVFILGSFIAGFCGLFGAPVLSINLSLGWDTLFLAVMVVMVGGVGSVQGALAGGLVIGLADTFGKAYFPEFAYFTLYLVLIVVLLFKPSGLLGRAMGAQQATEELQAASLLETKGVPLQKASAAAAQGKARKAWLFSVGPYAIIGIILVVFGLPDLLPAYFLSMMTKILIFAIFALSLNLIMGYTGLPSLGHAAFFGLAGYTAGIFMVHYGIESIWLVAPLAIIVAGIGAAIIGYLVLRVSGIPFLLVTFAFGQLLYVVAVKWRSVTGGTDGLSGIPYPALGLPGFSLTDNSFYYLVFVIFAICFFLLYRIINSPFGRTLVGIRENEPRMQALGYNTWAHKYTAFIIAGLFAGVAGSLFSPFYGIIVPEHLGVITSTLAMLMVIIGSAGTLFGPILGAALIVFLEHFISIYTPERWPLILGGIFVICVLFVRAGFGVYLARSWRKVKLQYGSQEKTPRHGVDLSV